MTPQEAMNEYKIKWKELRKKFDDSKKRDDRVEMKRLGRELGLLSILYSERFEEHKEEEYEKEEYEEIIYDLNNQFEYWFDSLDAENLSKHEIARKAVLWSIDFFVDKKHIKSEDLCTIFELDSDFKKLVDKSMLNETALEIWNNPSCYSSYKNGTEDAYYKFLKKVYIKFPDGREQSIASYLSKLKLI